MSFIDKAKDKGQEVMGKTKQQTGEVTGDEDLKNEGRADEAKGDLKQAGEKVKDAFN
ncbi:MAG: CsbD family protein [Actinomycetota bacterium]|nr:CsbD family protein [Actinomycetota bacterium]